MAEDREKTIECAEKIGKNFEVWADEYTKRTEKNSRWLSWCQTGSRWKRVCAG